MIRSANCCWARVCAAHSTNCDMTRCADCCVLHGAANLWRPLSVGCASQFDKGLHCELSKKRYWTNLWGSCSMGGCRKRWLGLGRQTPVVMQSRDEASNATHLQLAVSVLASAMNAAMADLKLIVVFISRFVQSNEKRPHMLTVVR